jgi:hypothetical protein
MSENITHTAVVDDGLRLMQASGTICEPFKLAAREHLDMAHLGCMTRAGDRCNPGLLAAFRDRWADRTPDDHLEPKLAFVLGWLCHRAADRETKPIFRRFHPKKEQSPTECSVYHDAFVFNEIYAGGEEPPYHPAMFGEGFEALRGAAPVESLSELIHVLLRRALIEMHTLIPDESQPEAWIDRLFTRKQRFYVDLARYEAAITNPDPDKVRRYIIEDRFYDREAPIIRTARALQHGEDLAPDAVDRAIDAGSRSHYGHALFLAMGYLRAASAFFTGWIEMDALTRRLDIGKPGRDGQPV